MANIKFSAFTQLAPIDQTNSYIVGYEGDANTNNRWTFGEVAIGLKAVTATPYSIYSASGTLEATREVTFSAHDLKFIATGNGKLWYQDGNQAAGKVLKSDGDGEASWAVETDTNTTYDLTAPSVGTLRLTGSDSTTDDVSISGSNGVTISQLAANNINIVGPTLPIGSNPSTTISGTVVNGSASTFMRSDAVPALGSTITIGTGGTTRGLVDIEGGSSLDAQLRLNCSAGTHAVVIEGPQHSGGSNYIIKLPHGAPALNKILKVGTYAANAGTYADPSLATMIWADDTDTSIYSADGNLTADRTVTMNNTAANAPYNLTFAGITTSKVTFSNLGGVQFDEDVTFVKNTIIQGQAYTELNSLSNTLTVNWNDSNVQTISGLTGAHTFTPTNPKAGATYILTLIQTGAVTATWGSYIKWAAPDSAATPPTLSGAGKTDVITLICWSATANSGAGGYYGSITKDLS